MHHFEATGRQKLDEAGSTRHFSSEPAWQTWAFIATVISLVGDFLKPEIYWLIPFLFIASLATLAFVYYKSRPIRSFSHRDRNIFYFALFSSAIFFLVTVGEAFTATPVGPNPGLLARYVPGVSSAQTALLPLTPTETALLELQHGLRSPNILDRVEAARRAMTLPDLDGRRAVMVALLRSDDPELHAVAVMEALKLKEGHYLPILVDPNNKRGALSNGLSGARVFLKTVDVEGNDFDGSLDFASRQDVATHGFALSGSVSADRVTMASSLYLQTAGAQLYNVSFDFALKSNLEFIGTAQTNDGEIVNVSLPLL